MIDKYKNPLLIKSNLFCVTYTKDRAWAELTKEFNSLNTGYEYERTADVLKTKWDNLKRLARKSSKNVIELGDESFHNEIIRDVIIICGADVGPIVEPESDEEPGKIFKNKIPLLAVWKRFKYLPTQHIFLSRRPDSTLKLWLFSIKSSKYENRQ